MVVKKKKTKNLKLVTAAAVTAAAGALPTAVKASGGDGGDGGSSTATALGQAIASRSMTAIGKIGSYSTNVSVATNKGYANISVTTGNFGITASMDPSSCPFLLTWDGEEYQHDNDFLLAKPTSLFGSYELGVKAYQAGISGDTYLLKNNLVPDQDGNLKLQIRELEPEESYIDKFTLCAVDLQPTERLVVDGNLVDSYVFDTSQVRVPEQNLSHFHKKLGSFTQETNAYSGLVASGDKDITLQTGDELVVRVPRARLSDNQDYFLLVDSHYRDWTLGNQVPFSTLERFKIGSLALGKKLTTTTAALAVFLGVMQVPPLDSEQLKKVLSLPYAYADTPHTPGGNGGYSQGSYGGGGKYGGAGGKYGSGGADGKSLVVSAGDDIKQTYLQTLFPRYVQSSQEVVRIPKRVIKASRGDFLAVRIKATKKHKVRTALVFAGEPKDSNYQPLKTLSAKHSRTSNDYAASLESKTQTFMHTIPGDVVDLKIKDIPRRKGVTRLYVLKADGFYTKLSPKVRNHIGKNWLSRLDTKDRQLLSTLRLS